jgi:hypothetical protein
MVSVREKVIEILRKIDSMSPRDKRLFFMPTMRIRFFLDVKACIDALLTKAQNDLALGKLDAREIMIRAHQCLIRIDVDAHKNLISPNVAEIMRMIVREVMNRSMNKTLTIEDIVDLRTLLENISGLVQIFG